MAKCNVQARNDFIILEVDEGEEKSPLAVVDSQNKNQQLIVVSIGDKVDSCEVGDKVIPYNQEVRAFIFEGKQYIVLRNDELMGVIK